MTLNAKQFIRKYLIQEIGRAQEYDLHYHSFGLIAQGIEFLGACLDNHEFDEEYLSRTRFRNTIDELFSDSYKKFNKKDSVFDLYGNLRCGLLHFFMPKNSIELIQRSEVTKFKGDHLDIVPVRGKDRLLLVSELFYDERL